MTTLSHHGQANGTADVTKSPLLQMTDVDNNDITDNNNSLDNNTNRQASFVQPQNINNSNSLIFHNDENSQTTINAKRNIISNINIEKNDCSLTNQPTLITDRNPLASLTKDNYNFLFDIMSMNLAGQQQGILASPTDSQSLLASALKSCSQLQLSQILAASPQQQQQNTMTGPPLYGKMKIEALLENYQTLQNNLNNNTSNSSSGNSTCSPTGTSSTKSCCTSPLSSNGNFSKTDSDISRKSSVHHQIATIKTSSSSSSVIDNNNKNISEKTSLGDSFAELVNEDIIKPSISPQLPTLLNQQQQQHQSQDAQSNESSSIDGGVNTFHQNHQLNSSSLLQSPDGKKCSFCNKTFTCASALRIHFRKHSGERPYKCKFCCKAFSQNGTLKRHYQTCKSAPHNRGQHNGGNKVIIETPGERTMTNSTHSNNKNVMIPVTIATTPTSTPTPASLGLVTSSPKLCNTNNSLIETFSNRTTTKNLTTANHFSLPSPKIAETSPSSSCPFSDGLSLFGSNNTNNINTNTTDHIQLLNRATEMLKSGFIPTTFKYPQNLASVANVGPLNGLANQKNFLQTLASSFNFLPPMVSQIGQSPDTQTPGITLKRSSPPISTSSSSSSSSSNPSSLNSSPLEQNIDGQSFGKMPKLENNNNNVLQTQLILELRANPLIFPCDNCNIFFINENDLDQHLEYHAKNAPAPFTCSKCLAVLSNSADFQRHFINEHS